MSIDLPIFVAAARDKAMSQVEANAGPCFTARALEFVVKQLKKNGEMPGEEITDACVEAGIEPHDARAFGPVFKALIKDNLIERCGSCLRKKGRGTNGGSVYRLKV